MRNPFTVKTISKYQVIINCSVHFTNDKEDVSWTVFKN